MTKKHLLKIHIKIIIGIFFISLNMPVNVLASGQDLCSNIDGVQTEVPYGYELTEEGCTKIPYHPLIISEFLPNPASPKTDSDDEFIELFNPHYFTVNIDGYTLMTGNDWQYSYTFQNIEIQPNGYIVVYSIETNLVLANASSRISLRDPLGEVLGNVVSYESSKENYSWALIGGIWSQTIASTPGEPNQSPNDTSSENQTDTESGGLAPCPVGKYRNPATNRCKNIESGSTLKPCAPDQFRNPATNRCKKMDSISSLKPCQTGQYRNPATNRCKSIISSTQTLKPCAQDQFRNPETNRCKKKDSGNNLKPCKEGQERNPETNRCRKVAGATTADPISTVASTTAAKVSLPILAAIGSIAGGYGIYEYRGNIATQLRRVFRRSSK